MSLQTVKNKSKGIRYLKKNGQNKESRKRKVDRGRSPQKEKFKADKYPAFTE